MNHFPENVNAENVKFYDFFFFFFEKLNFVKKNDIDDNFCKKKEELLLLKLVYMAIKSGLHKLGP